MVCPVTKIKGGVIIGMVEQPKEEKVEAPVPEKPKKQAKK